MYENCLEKQQCVKKLFESCENEEQKYQKIIALGKELSGLPDFEKITENIVKGCQSTVYLTTKQDERGLIHFAADSDALISAGLAAVLIKVYSGESAESILKCPPDYLEELGISASLTPGRANGLYSIHLKMKQEALKIYIKTQVAP